jgi:hypothetical protein
MTNEEALAQQAANLQEALEKSRGKRNANELTDSLSRQGLLGRNGVVAPLADGMKAIVQRGDIEMLERFGAEALLKDMQDAPNPAAARDKEDAYLDWRASQREAHNRRKGRVT